LPHVGQWYQTWTKNSIDDMLKSVGDRNGKLRRENRRAIDKEQFNPPVGFAILLTILASLIGALLAVYLLLTA